MILSIAPIFERRRGIRRHTAVNDKRLDRAAISMCVTDTVCSVVPIPAAVSSPEADETFERRRGIRRHTAVNDKRLDRAAISMCVTDTVCSVVPIPAAVSSPEADETPAHGARRTVRRGAGI
jgi:hypothetical protein